jgi:hypothetical protein
MKRPCPYVHRHLSPGDSTRVHCRGRHRTTAVPGSERSHRASVRADCAAVAARGHRKPRLRATLMPKHHLNGAKRLGGHEDLLEQDWAITDSLSVPAQGDPASPRTIQHIPKRTGVDVTKPRRQPCTGLASTGISRDVGQRASTSVES